MAVTAEEVRIIVDAATDKAIKGLKNTDKQSNSLFNSFKKLAGPLAVGAVVAGFVKATKVAKELIDAYSVQEQAETALTAAIKATGREGEITLTSMKDYASSLQEVTLFGDEAILSGQALLQSLADLDQEGLQTVTPHVLDFATAMGVDVKSAMSLVGKTLGSSTNALARYGIEIDTSLSKSEKLAQLTEQLESKFGGMAEAAGDTATGDIVQLTNAMGDFEESLGRVVAEGINPFVRSLTDMVAELTESLDATSDLQASIDQYKETGRVVGDLEQLERDLATTREKLITQPYNIILLEQVSALEKAIVAEKTRNVGLEYATERIEAQVESEKKLAEQQENTAKALAEYLELVDKEFAKTSEGQLQALENEIKMWEAYAETAVNTSDEVNTILQAKRDELARLTEEENTILEDAQNLRDEQLARERDRYAELGEAVKERVDREKAAQEELRREYEETALTVISTTGDLVSSFAEAVASGEGFSKALGAFAKDAAVTILKTLGERAAAQAALLYASALVPGGQVNLPAAAAYTTASLGAFAAAGAVSAFATGGDFVTKGPQLIQVGDNPGGRERVQVTPLSSPNINGPQTAQQPIQFILNGRVIGEALGDLTDRNQMLINQKAVVRR